MNVLPPWVDRYCVSTMSMAQGGLGSPLSGTHPRNQHLSTLHLALEMKAQEDLGFTQSHSFYGRKLDLGPREGLFTLLPHLDTSVQ